MKRKLFGKQTGRFNASVVALIALALMAGFTLAACGGEDGGGDGIVIKSTSGKLTVTGLDEYKGKYIYGAGFTADEFENLLEKAIDEDAEIEELEVLFAADNISATSLTLAKISNAGTAVLKVWKVTETIINEDEDDYEITYSNYNGSDAALFVLEIFDIPVLSEETSENIEPIGTGFVFVEDFRNGTGTGEFLGVEDLLED